MPDFKISVEYRSTPKGPRFVNDYEYMFEMMDAVYEIMNKHPQAELKIKKVWTNRENR